MKKRMLLVGGLLLLLLGTLGFVKYMQIRAAIAQGSAWRPPPEAVTTMIASKEDWPATEQAIGSVVATRGVTVSADLAGVVQGIHFESGRTVHAGDLLVQLDTRQERAQREAAEAQRELAQLNLERGKSLLAQNLIAKADYDLLVAQAKSADANVGEIDATIQRKTIRAPFTGVAGIRQVDIGQYLTSGAAIVPLQAMDPVYVNFSMPQQDVASLAVGAEVRVSSDSGAVSATGRISAINSVVDEATRNVQVQATFRNPHGTLRPGMFVDVQVTVGRAGAVTAIPTSAINYAPYGNSVFIVADMKGPDGKSYRGVKQQFVKVGISRGDLVAIVSGVEPGQEVVTSGVFKLRNGAAVLVNNQMKPGSNPAPKPEDS